MSPEKKSPPKPRPKPRPPTRPPLTEGYDYDIPPKKKG